MVSDTIVDNPETLGNLDFHAVGNPLTTQIADALLQPSPILSSQRKDVKFYDQAPMQ